jgi:L-amino acid N-acyltransferase YncA
VREAAEPEGRGGVRVGSMDRSDWPAVRDIYRAGIATDQATFETDVPSWDGWDRAHLPTPRLVARDGETVVGWAALSPVSPRSVYAGVAEVSVYVAEDAQGRGVGRTLLEALVAASEEAGLWTLQAVTFPENEASLALHRRCGFRVVGTRERIARRGAAWRDTVLLERRSRRVGR